MPIRNRTLPAVNSEFETLARELWEAAIRLGSLNVEFELEQDVLDTIEEARRNLLRILFQQQAAVADTVKSLQRPLRIIPASLHPIN